MKRHDATTDSKPRQPPKPRMALSEIHAWLPTCKCGAIDEFDVTKTYWPVKRPTKEQTVTCLNCGKRQKIIWRWATA